MQYHSLLDLIVTDHNSVFISKFQFLFYYFLGIKQKLLTTFYLQTNGLTKKQIVPCRNLISKFSSISNKMIGLDSYLQLNLSIIIQKNTSDCYTLFKLNCGQHSETFYEENRDPSSKFRLATELVLELSDLLITYREKLQYIQNP